jgi:hypothetical protein
MSRRVPLSYLQNIDLIMEYTYQVLYGIQISWTDAARARLHQFSREEQILFPIVKTCISEVHATLP